MVDVSSLSRREKKVAVLSKLARRTKIGMSYIPREKAYSKIPQHARGGMEDVLDELRQEGLLEFHKNGRCISLNPRSLDRVSEILEGEVPGYILENLKR